MFLLYQDRVDMTFRFNERMRACGVGGYVANMLSGSPPTLTVSNCYGKVFGVLVVDGKTLVRLKGSVRDVDHSVFQVAIDLMNEYYEKFR